MASLKAKYIVSGIVIVILLFMLYSQFYNETLTPKLCDRNHAWSWRTTPREGLGSWMDEIGHNHVGHGQF